MIRPPAAGLSLPHDLPALRLPPDFRHNIFLITKEALTNALKHASRKKEVHVQRQRISANGLEIIVQDNGKGFDMNVPPEEGRRHGLGNMQQRAENMGGKLTRQCSPAEGTVIQLVVPLPNESIPD